MLDLPSKWGILLVVRFNEVGGKSRAPFSWIGRKRIARLRKPYVTLANLHEKKVLTKDVIVARLDLAPTGYGVESKLDWAEEARQRQ